MKTSDPAILASLVFSTRMQGMKPSAIREILKTTEAPEIISFAGGLPAPELFPSAEIARAAQFVMANDPVGALQYGVTEGYGPLRTWIAIHCAETVGLKISASNVLITQGSQQGLDLIGKVLLDPGDTVLVESPGYLGALQAFQAYQANIVGLEADAEGPRVDQLEVHLKFAAKPPKFLYLIPNYQNPTGTSISLARRRALAVVAARHGLLVVEDDPYGRLRYTGEEIPALGAMASSLHWIYLGTVSKMLAPGLRVAWLVTSHVELFRHLVTAKQAADLHTSTFTQRVVFEVMQSEEWLSAHLATLCTAYARRRDVMLAALEENLSSVNAHWTRPEGGLFLWVTLPPQLDTLELLKSASAHKIAFVPGAPFWVGKVQRNTLRLNFSNATETRIEEGVARLGQLIRSAL